MDINALKNYFEDHKDIAFAFLFDSHARRIATKISDINIAVYFYPAERHPIEYEEEVFYKGKDEVWDDLKKILGREVEMLVMNRVSANIAASAIRGIPLAINDWELYLDFMLFITSLAEDFRLRIGHKCLISSF